VETVILVSAVFFFCVYSDFGVYSIVLVSSVNGQLREALTKSKGLSFKELEVWFSKAFVSDKSKKVFSNPKHIAQKKGITPFSVLSD
jgi:hypothetical protein